jgi:uncharacterized protein YecE (DUF72 family)
VFVHRSGDPIPALRHSRAHTVSSQTERSPYPADVVGRHWYIGTAGWTVPRAVADHFTGLGSALVRYATRLGAAEINSTFWGRHKTETFARWRSSVPRGFRFAVKLPRAITHEAELVGAKALLVEFFTDISGLGDRLGPILIQLPPSLAFQSRRTAGFLRALRGIHDGPVVCEPRHPTWFTPGADALLAAHQVARVAADPPRAARADQPGGSTSMAYFRLHGSPVVYRSAYTGARLELLVRQIGALAAHTPVWCIFDNTASGAAAADALTLTSLVQGSIGFRR